MKQRVNDNQIYTTNLALASGEKKCVFTYYEIYLADVEMPPAIETSGMRYDFFIAKQRQLIDNHGIF